MEPVLDKGGGGGGGRLGVGLTAPRLVKTP